MPQSAVRAATERMSSPTGVGLDSSAVRARMVKKLAEQGIDDAAVLEAMGRVERHRFVDTALANQAYEDTSLPIGLGQTISKPNVVARMIALLRQAPLAQQGQELGRVLEIGTGCGYQAAVLACVAKEVYSIERLRGLHDKARENLRPMRIPNVHLIFGDGMEGYAKGGPYSAIIAAAGGEAMPQAWIDQLALGGRIVAPMQMANGQQALVVIDKTAQGLRQSLLEPVLFVPLKSGIA
jgi:protein-L-isoaspartate(D-aspartate) O-methyltransferase